MFGGVSVSHDGRPFALVFDGQVYVKASQQTSLAFAAAGSEPFTSIRNGREMALSYWTAPLDTLGSPDEMKLWADLALSVAKVPTARRSSRRQPSGRA